MFLLPSSLLEVDIGCLLAGIDHELNDARFPVLIARKHRFELYSVGYVSEAKDNCANLEVRVSMDMSNEGEVLQRPQTLALRTQRAL